MLFIELQHINVVTKKRVVMIETMLNVCYSRYRCLLFERYKIVRFQGRVYKYDKLRRELAQVRYDVFFAVGS